MGNNHIQLSRTHHLGIKHILLPPPHTWAVTTSNCHGNTRGHQTQSSPSDIWAPTTSTATTIHVGANHPHPSAIATHVGSHNIQLPPPLTWTLTTSNCYRHTRGHPITSNCHGHARGHLPRTTSTVKHMDTKHFQPGGWGVCVCGGGGGGQYQNRELFILVSGTKSWVGA